MIFPLAIGLTVLPTQTTSAVPITLIMEVVKAAVKKAIQAIDLKVQRLQNQTIWLQNAQKVLENKLSKLKLQEIYDWSDKQREQYEGLFQELWKVKSLISQINRVKEIADMQKQLVKEYQQAWSLANSSSVLRSEEKELIGKVYQRILNASLEHLNHLMGIMTSFTSQMNDADRLATIHLTEDNIRKNLEELRRVNAQNYKIMHSRTMKSMNIIKENYGVD
ncbi:conjugal transfer protein TraI [Algoriphagus sp. AGSA1]|nr:conjugal transfer protein TraI [Algoriphagus sp. AGSA1]